MHVILLAHAVPFPGRPAENRQPVVRRRAVRLRIGPDIPVGFRVAAARPALDKPGMPVGRVRDHLIDDDLEPETMGLRHHLVEIVQRPELRIDIAIIRDVIAHVRLRRLEEGRQPDRVDTEKGDMAKPLRDAFQVADAAGRRILKRARIDLIDRGAAPPVCGNRAGFQNGCHADSFKSKNTGIHAGYAAPLSTARAQGAAVVQPVIRTSHSHGIMKMTHETGVAAA